jgi:hypothetical protein
VTTISASACPSPSGEAFGSCNRQHLDSAPCHLEYFIKNSISLFPELIGERNPECGVCEHTICQYTYKWGRFLRSRNRQHLYSASCRAGIIYHKTYDLCVPIHGMTRNDGFRICERDICWRRYPKLLDLFAPSSWTCVSMPF